MDLLRKMKNPDEFRKRFIFTDAFFSFCILIFIVADCIISLRFYTPYEPIPGILLSLMLMGLLAGNLTGKLVSQRFVKSPMFYPVADILYIICSIIYIFRSFIPYEGTDILAEMYFSAQVYAFLFFFLMSFMIGIKTNQIFQIAAVTSDNYRKSITALINAILLGILAGIFFSTLAYLYDICFYTAVLPVLFLILIVLLKYLMPHSPAGSLTMLRDENSSQNNKKKHRDDLLFTYLNFAYIAIYVNFVFLTISRFYGSAFPIQYTLFSGIIITIILGVTIGLYLKVFDGHITLSVLFPVLFLLFLILVNIYHAKYPFYLGISFFLPASFIFGLSISQAIRNVSSVFDKSRQFSLINFSLFVLPIPICLVLQNLVLTNQWFYTVFYLLALLNVLLPVVHIMQSTIKNYKKALYFGFSLLFIPLIITLHLYFKIPFNNELFVEKSDGFSDLLKINTSASFIKKSTPVFYNKKTIFIASDSSIKNLERSLLPVLLFINRNPASKSKTLFIDGNQKFFKNPVLNFFPEVYCLDYLAGRNVDYNRPQVSRTINYISDEESLPSFLFNNKNLYRAIIDLPNLYDQFCYPYLFSTEFYRKVKSFLEKDGLFTQVFNLQVCQKELMVTALSNFIETFKHRSMFLFTDYLVLIGSDTEMSSLIKQENFNFIQDTYYNSKILSTLFYNEYQILSHHISPDEKLFADMDKPLRFKPLYYFEKPSVINLAEGAMDSYLYGNLSILELLEGKQIPYPFIATIADRLRRDSFIFSLLKTASLYELNNEYETETETLFKLKELSNYNYELRKYILSILSFKEEYYLQEAKKLESQKKWQMAARLYNSILQINRNNFEANYRMGLLSITLQDIKSAFNYFQYALQLKNNDTRVLYQMGILHFSDGQINKALQYFLQTMNLNENSASLFHHIGLCYEEMDRFYDAKRYYQRALLKDPNDYTIKSSLKRINAIISEEVKKWESKEPANQTDVEKGVKIPIPINKSAHDVRLKDSELKDYENIQDSPSKQ